MDKLFLAIVNMSLTGAFVIAAICLARQLLKKAPKIISYALWAVAGFRLVFPFSIESVFSLIPFTAAPIPADIAMQPIPHINSGVMIVDNITSGSLPSPMLGASVNPLQIWMAIGAFVWLIGIAIMLIYGVFSFVNLKGKMKEAAHCEANIYETAQIKSPFVLGIFSPKIYLPAGLSEHERGYILLHEQTHIRRRDHIVKFAAYFVLCLHWFNPLAWVAFLLMGADMEMACDERVMRELGGDIRDDYSKSLVCIAAGRRIPCGGTLAFSAGGMKERVKRVLNFKNPSRMIIVAAAAVAVALSVGFALDRAVAVKPLTNILGGSYMQEANDWHKQYFLSPPYVYAGYRTRGGIQTPVLRQQPFIKDNQYIVFEEMLCSYGVTSALASSEVVKLLGIYGANIFAYGSDNTITYTATDDAQFDYIIKPCAGDNVIEWSNDVFNYRVFGPVDNVSLLEMAEKWQEMREELAGYERGGNNG